MLQRYSVGGSGRAGCGLALVAILCLTAGAPGQEHEADAAATEAFQTLIDGYRARPFVRVNSTVSIELSQDGASAGGREVSAELAFAGHGRGVLKLNGFVCYMDDGQIHAVHEGTDHSYYSTPDDGAPYYLLLNAFVDMPFPHLAIALGETDIDDVCMQFHPSAPWVKPTTVVDTEDGGRRISLTSDFSVMHVDVDDGGLIEAIELTISGGTFVQDGATLVYRYAFRYDTFDEIPADSGLEFERGERQRVDMLGALMPKAEAPEAALAGGDEGGLVGQPAPPLVLATADGRAVDLEELRGRIVVLDFWATWCGPCRVALPQLHEVAAWADEAQLPVEVITVNVWEVRGGDDTAEARLESARTFWEKQGFTLPVAMDYTDEVVEAYGVRGIPATFVIRSDGIVHAQHTGAGPSYVEDLKTEITEAIAALEE